MLKEQASITKLRWIMAELRDPKTGCPWDIKQTFDTITNHTLEEAYEVVDAIEQGDFVELEKELGDLLFQVIFYSQLGQEQAYFNFDTVVNVVCEKLIRRHPHVFADAKLQSDAEIKANWENEKTLERAIKHQQFEENEKLTPLSILADIPKNLPALSQAAKIQKRCAHVGFDWDNKYDVFAKIEEEVQEVKEELEKTPIDKNNLAEELGDLMFAVVNLCRHANADPETLLRKANTKFSRRFKAVEAHVNDSGKSLVEHDLETLEHFWQLVKQQEKKG
jgi:ATP diphosphatase